MKLKIETVEEVDGKTLRDYWKSPMFVVNGKYVASSIDDHNFDKKPFDLKVGEDVEVTLDPDRRFPSTIWISRNN